MPNDNPAPKPHATANDEGERIAKVIARAGVCSRRDAERLIADGRVSVNGRAIHSPALNVTPADAIAVDGAPLPTADSARLWRYHKPRGRVTTHKDPEGRPTVFEALPEDLPRVISVGRLDFNTEGLILLTNSGALARHLELPATGWMRRYRVRAHGTVTEAALKALADGITIDGVRYAGIEASLDRHQGANVWVTLSLREGKNREVRKILMSLGLDVNRLIRTSYGPFQLGDLDTGQVEEIPPRVLREQFGKEKSREFGFGGPVRGKLTQAEPRPVAEATAEPSKRPKRRPLPKREGAQHARLTGVGNAEHRGKPHRSSQSSEAAKAKSGARARFKRDKER